MRKKLVVTSAMLVALAALAAMPVIASAANDPDLTESKGGPLLKVGSGFLGTNTGVVRLTNAAGESVVECTSATLTGKVQKNDGTTLGLDVELANFSGTGAKSGSLTECTGLLNNTIVTMAPAGGLPWCLQSTPLMADDNFALTGGTCEEKARAIHINLDSTAFGTCKYGFPIGFLGTFTTEATSDAIFTIGGGEVENAEEGGFFCPPVKLDFSFTLEKDNTMKSEPLYIS